ncbi:MAG: MBL fold metallo-hydrolase [Oscillospiraceae bacterium]|nr:MBL fold metallo-hydrolase [Oscillospiraceae bacterium]
MDKITRLPLGPLATNCYIIPAENGKAIIVDPASTSEVEAILDTSELKLGAIIITHGHFDHFAGAAALQARTNAPIYAPELDREMFQSEDKSWAWFMGGIPFSPITPSNYFSGGDRFSLFGEDFAVMNAPGHTSGSCLLFCDKHNCIFAGDVIFRGSVGRTDGYSGSMAQQRDSLKQIRTIEHNYNIFCGHGDTTDIETEKRTNPYLLDM